ncbi:MAG TPA: hypothetical protein VLW54_02925 [Candidatus Acidoferrales bacterium]|nr:hypothetical protein [Candidatus Acidoferrales bacterium]
MQVSRSKLVTVLALVAALALVMPALAGTKSTLTIADHCQFAGTKVAPGEYVMQVEGNTVKLLRNNKVIASATGEWKKADGKYRENGYACNADGQVVQVHVAGQDSYLAIG